MQVTPLRVVDPDACASLLAKLSSEVLPTIHQSTTTTTTTTTTNHGNQQAQDSLGMAMVLTLAQSTKVSHIPYPIPLGMSCLAKDARLQEWLEQLKDEIARQRREEEEMLRQEVLLQEAVVKGIEVLHFADPPMATKLTLIAPVASIGA